jgi:hypothetical protein
MVEVFIVTFYVWTSNSTCTNILWFIKYKINKTFNP